MPRTGAVVCEQSVCRSRPGVMGRRGAALRRLVIGLVVVVVAVPVLVALLGPPIASSLAPGIIASSVNPKIAGEVKVDSASLSWGGPLRVEGVTLTDPSGGRVAEFEAEVGAGLWALLTGSRDLGEVRLAGSATIEAGAQGTTNLDRAIAPTGPAAPAPMGGSGPPPPAPSQPITLPRGLAFDLNIDGVDVSFKSTDASGRAREVALTGIKGGGKFALGQPVAMKVEATTPDNNGSLSVELDADQITTADGALTLDKAVATLDFATSLPGSYAEVVGAGLAGVPVVSPDLAAQARSIDTIGSVRLDGGRLTLVDPAQPIVLTAPIPLAVASAASTSNASIELDPGAWVSFELNRLDLPIAALTEGASADLRGAIARAYVRTGVIKGWVTTPSEGRKRFAITTEPFSVGSSMGLDRGFGAAGRASVTLDGEPAGMLVIEADTRGLLTPEGALRPTLPDRITSDIELRDLPTSLIGPFVDRALASSGQEPIDLSRTFGPRVGVRLKLNVPDDFETNPDATILIDGEVGSSLTDVWLAAEASPAGRELRARKEGLTVRTTALGYLNERFDIAGTLSEAIGGDVEVVGDGLANVDIGNFTVPLNGFVPVIGGVSATGAAVVGELAVRPAFLSAPLEGTNLGTSLAWVPGDPVRFGGNYTLTYQGTTITINAQGSLPGLVDWSADPGFALTPGAVRPQGSLAFKGVPAKLIDEVLRGLANVNDERLLSAVGSAVGDSVGGRAEVAAASDGDADGVVLSAQGGGFRFGASSMVSREGGATTVSTKQGQTAVQLTKLGAMMGALLGDEGAVRITGAGPALVELTDSRLTLRPGSPIEATGGASIVASALQFAGGGASGFGNARVDTLRVGVSADSPTGGAAFDINAQGSVDGAPMTAAGGLNFEEAFTLDDTGFVLAPGSASATGELSVTGLPTALASAADPRLGRLLPTAVGATADLEVIAKGRTMTARVATPADRLVATTDIAFGNDETITIGPSSAQLARLDQATIDAALAAYAPELSLTQRLSAPVALNISATPIRLASVNGGGFAPAGSWSATLKPDRDLLISGVELPIGESTPATVSLREVTAGAQFDGAAPSRISAQAAVYDPASPLEPLARLNLSAPGAGVENLDVSATGVRPPAIDTLFKTDGVLTAALGNTASFTARTAPAGAGVMRADVNVAADRAKLTAAATVADDRIALVEPASLDWRVGRAAVGAAFGVTAQGEPRLIPDDDVTISGRVDRFTMTKAGGDVPFAIAALDASFTTTPAQLRAPEGEVARIGATTLTARWDDPTRRLLVDVNEASEDAGALRASLAVRNLEPAPAGATPRPRVIDGEVKGRLATLIFDALGEQDGRLVALLGPTVESDVVLTNLAVDGTSGRVDGQLRSQTSQASLQGDLASGVLTISEPAVAELSVITPEASRRWVEPLLVVLKEFEKTADQKPAVLRADSLSYPIDGDLSKLNGKINVDLGTVRFKTGPLLGEILKATSNRIEGDLGRRVEPFVVTITNGVASLAETSIPVGEYSIRMSGTFDLVNERVDDMVLLVPLSRVNERLASAAGQIPGLNELTMVPIRIKGPYGSLKYEFAPEQLLKNPERLLEGVGKGLEDLFGGKKKK